METPLRILAWAGVVAAAAICIAVAFSALFGN
jgi:hypothetical protein